MPASPLQAVVFSHLPFEDLGSLQPALEQRGFAIQTIDVATARFPLPETERCDLLIVMGGPIGVYDSGDYPFLTGEIDALRQRLAARKPTLGICLGAQLMAAALGARVYHGDRGAEIGWFPILPAWQPAPAPRPTGSPRSSPTISTCSIGTAIPSIFPPAPSTSPGPISTKIKPLPSKTTRWRCNSTLK